MAQDIRPDAEREASKNISLPREPSSEVPEAALIPAARSTCFGDAYRDVVVLPLEKRVAIRAAKIAVIASVRRVDRPRRGRWCILVMNLLRAANDVAVRSMVCRTATSDCF